MFVKCTSDDIIHTDDATEDMIQIVRIPEGHSVQTTQYKDSDQYFVSLVKDTSQEQQMNKSFPILSTDEWRQVLRSPPGQHIQTLEHSGVLQVTSIPQPTSQPIT